jgi:hypothetical protein
MQASGREGGRTDERTDRQTDMVKLTVAFRNLVYRSRHRVNQSIEKKGMFVYQESSTRKPAVN